MNFCRIRIGIRIILFYKSISAVQAYSCPNVYHNILFFAVRRSFRQPAARFQASSRRRRQRNASPPYVSPVPVRRSRVATAGSVSLTSSMDSRFTRAHCRRTQSTLSTSNASSTGWCTRATKNLSKRRRCCAEKRQFLSTSRQRRN